MVIHLTYGSGLGPGISSVGKAFAEAMKKRVEQKVLESIFPQQQQQQQQGQGEPDEQFQQDFKNMVNEYAQTTGEQLDPQSLDFLWKSAQGQSETAQPSATAQQQGQQPQYSTKQLAALSARNPALAGVLQKQQLAQQKMDQQQLIAREKMAFKSNEPFMKELDAQRAAIPNQEANIMRIGNVIGSGDLNSLRNLAAEFFSNRIPPEFLATKDANELRSAVKDAFINDLKQLPTGSRLNQFIEQNVMSALESPLKSPENNAIILEAKKFDIENKKKRIEIADKLMESYERMGRQPPSYFSRKVDQYLKPFVDQNIKNLTQKINEIKGGKVGLSESEQKAKAWEAVKGQKPPDGYVFMQSPIAPFKVVPVERGKAKEAQQKFGGELRQ